MAIAFLQSSAVRSAMLRMVRPKTRWGRITFWLGAVSLLLWVAAAMPGSRFGGWAALCTTLFAFSALLLFCRWVYRPLLWRLRNRLIVTFLFIGVMPILLLLLMGGLASYLFAGQFSTFIAISDLRSELQHLQAANDALAAQLFPLEREGRLTERIAGEFTRASDERFPGRTVSLDRSVPTDQAGSIDRAGKSFVLNTQGSLMGTIPAVVPDFISADFTGFVIDHGLLHMRAIRLDENHREVALVSDMPITPNLLLPTADRLGAVTLLPLLPDAAGEINLAGRMVTAGAVSNRTHWFDVTLHFGTFFAVTDWRSGKQQELGILYVATRPSMLYATLFATLGDKALIFRDLLLAIGVIFGLIELAALYIGIRLSRSMTVSVSELYEATEHVNRGDLNHRIQVNGRDQMAALEGSFNSMTGSLARLIGEQKEKQRLENELSIAYEVQELLFPHQTVDLPGLEMHGLCVPARTVSGDYYDFIPLGTDRMVLAVGDISGKGISAALLMATVHAFVRAYSLEPEKALESNLVPAGSGTQGASRMYYRGDQNSDTPLAPAMLMTTLNYQLFRSTPAAKYATMFLGCYDPQARILRYCNGGHLPPYILRANGDVLTLDINGTVAGLFEGAAYEESTVVMEPGDIFLAYSDGVTEPENEFGEFGEDRLIALVQEHRRKPLPRITEIVTSAVRDWIGAAEQPDDITVVLARCNPIPRG